MTSRDGMYEYHWNMLEHLFQVDLEAVGDLPFL